MKKCRISNDSWIINKPIAHRGLHGEGVPENSKLAFEKAIEGGYPIETDLQLSSDGEIVCFHDDNLKRMTGYDKLIWEVDFAQLKTLRLNDSDEGIMTLSEFLALVSGRVPLMIEFKSQPNQKNLVDKALEILKDYKGEYAVQSFDPRIVLMFKKKAPRLIRGQLVSKDRHEWLSPVVDKLLSSCALNFLTKPDFINMDFKYLPLSKRLKRGKKTLTWTIKSQEDLQKIKPYTDNYIFENIHK